MALKVSPVNFVAGQNAAVILHPATTTEKMVRGLQGMGAAAASVVAIAVVGDLFSGTVAATVMSRLMLVLGVAPVLAPSLGAAVLLHGSWHWVFVALVNHPDFGWIPFTADPDDVEPHGRAIWAAINEAQKPA